ncbi:pilus assembly protein TadG-related protein [Oharaeibacter diazotrophicus]|uniref:Putative Flp pilus-assembly TadE/G-like protein n=1 Tax=Oharaeibacter diazotrophicus TaxID=1920512 RepID=A0A4V3CWN5_9HYPH|nr:pilus assembly protein TadG-related protein [Oharaeibacter diazotrophicus]TDP87028.1 putative Flp pilus-assembly TadE/G-like protein [Oharaeibacter diazotrophicus]BBE71029.1 hypothetical protein OHA_1_00599 [Pleomorphomonas sp. SM30]GLS77779.1 hypothetical protein GCM10007904_31160 [Oharaeibacter diazotrophicus]
MSSASAFPATFARDESGSTALAFAISFFVVAFSLGAAVDYGRQSDLKSNLQAAADSIALASATRGAALTQQEAKQLLNRTLAASGGRIDTVSVEGDGTGVFTVTLAAEVDASFLAIGGFDKLGATVSSKAKEATAKKLQSATMSIKSAKGTFDKEIYFVTYDKNGTVLKRQLMLTYDYTNKNGKISTKFTPTIGTATTITVTDYDSYAIEMVAYQDTTYTGKHTFPKTYSSKALDVSSFLKVAGACSDTAGSTMDWEDGGDGDYADLKTTLACTLQTTNQDGVRLTQ